MKRSQATTNTVEALEQGLEILWRGVFGEEAELEDTGVTTDLIHALYAEMGAVEKSELKEVPVREWRCEQDRWVSLFGAIGASVVADASPEEAAFLARQRGATITAADETEIAELVDWTPEVSATDRRAANWAARQR